MDISLSDARAFRASDDPHPAAQDSGYSDWRRRYARRLLLTDFLALVWVVFGTQMLWIGDRSEEVMGLPVISYWVFSTMLVVTWMIALALADTRSDRVIGVGNTEYVRIADASFRLFGLIAILAFLFQVDVARGYLLISLPLGVAVLVTARWLWRNWLAAQRSIGHYCARVLLVGSRESVAQIATELARTPQAGYRVVGACVPSGRIAESVPGADIPIMGSVDVVDKAVAATNADTVAVTSTDDLPPHKVKEISWSLEAGRQHLVLAPNIIDIAGPRIHTRPVAGLPLIHVETPRFSRGQRLTKRTFDIMSSAVLIALLSPVLAVVAIAVKASSRGPVLFSQERIGINGEPFRMHKFRSMRVGADDELAALLVEQGTSTEPLFKVRNDPRITPVGRFIRKYSLDELPQLFDVLTGSMSLVGPRPQVSAEVALYTDAARRRLLARPGITGLWQVSGRSSLDWGQTVRLDLYYVENWSLFGDIAILARTVRTVLAPGQTAH